jgi:hypothetical protein
MKLGVNMFELILMLQICGKCLAEALLAKFNVNVNLVRNSPTRNIEIIQLNER